LKLVIDQSNYFIEGFHQIKSIEVIADILQCFLESDYLLLFGCSDIKHFFENLHKEDKATQDLYQKLIELNYMQYGEGLVREDVEDKTNEAFITDRTVYNVEESAFPLYLGKNSNRRTIWFKTSNKIEVIKALELNNLFRCIVIKKGNEFQEFLFALEHCENEGGTDLIIMEKEKNSFIKYVLPRIQKLLDLEDLTSAMMDDPPSQA